MKTSRSSTTLFVSSFALVDENAHGLFGEVAANLSQNTEVFQGFLLPPYIVY